MHKPNAHMEKKIRPREIYKGLHIVPTMIGSDEYMNYLKKHNISHVISFANLKKDIVTRISENRIGQGDHPMVVGSAVIKSANSDSFGVYSVRVVPHESLMERLFPDRT